MAYDSPQNYPNHNSPPNHRSLRHHPPEHRRVHHQHDRSQHQAPQTIVRFAAVEQRHPLHPPVALCWYITLEFSLFSIRGGSDQVYGEVGIGRLDGGGDSRRYLGV